MLAIIFGPQLMWVDAGIVLLGTRAAITFYTYNLPSLVLEHLELKGNNKV